MVGTGDWLVIVEYLIVLLFFVLAVGFTIAEALWLSKKGWGSFGKSFGFAALTNVIGLGIGFFVIFMVSIVMMMVVFDNTIPKSSTTEFGFIAGVVFNVIFVPLLLIICKRIFLALFKLQSGKTAWLYSIASSLLLLIISLGIPGLSSYVFFKIYG